MNLQKNASHIPACGLRVGHMANLQAGRVNRVVKVDASNKFTVITFLFWDADQMISVEKTIQKRHQTTVEVYNV